MSTSLRIRCIGSNKLWPIITHHLLSDSLLWKLFLGVVSNSFGCTVNGHFRYEWKFSIVIRYYQVIVPIKLE